MQLPQVTVPSLPRFSLRAIGVIAAKPDLSGLYRKLGLGKADGPVVISGRYSAQWVKRDGNWLIRSEVFVALDGAGIGKDLKATP